ncbi:MAG: transporter permease [Candidatus Saccharibacteria bacterium]|nr:transporter permease [Candidatus Saccharibacteria bacterium]
MNVITRGARGAVRSPLRAGAIVIMLAISIGLIVAMLAAKAGVENKITSVKATAATGITVRPAGISGFGGGGDPLTTEQVATVTKAAHVVSAVSSLTDQLGTTDTNLVSSLTLGSFGQRQQRFESSSGTTSGAKPSTGAGSTDTARPAPTPRTSITGTTDPNSVATTGGSLTITSGTTIDGSSSAYVALVGSDLATKNNLTAGSTFTAYGQTYTVKGIFKTGSTFQDSGLIVPLATLQTATAQPGAVTSLAVIADSSDNVTTVVNSLKTALGDKADITSAQEQAATSVASLGSISSLATTGVIGASVASAVIVLLTMTMIVRERRREIGVIKAIGGTNFRVITQFMTEALTLTIIGGIIGLAFGIAVSGSITEGLVTSSQASSNTAQQSTPGGGGGRRLAQTAQAGLQAITSTVTPSTIATGIGLTLLIAVIGSALPAWFIARIRPAEVLRSE